jgi:hypothetical protein
VEAPRLRGLGKGYLSSTFALFRRYAAGARAYSNTALMGRDSFEKVP